MIDLARLSERERQVLRLLAQDHTAKSAACDLGVSPNTVNERLREARRKTGVASSRDLARRLCASETPETQDKEMGVDRRPAAALHASRRSSGASRGGSGMLASMFGLAGLVAVAGVLGARETATAVPHVVATSPKDGALVAPGRLDLSVTFDRPMRSDGYSFTRRPPATYPDCASTPVVSDGGRTFSLTCTLQPHRRYAVGLNSVHYRNFVSAAGSVAAAPALLRFATP